MKHFALDLETTGTNPQEDQILSIGIVAFELSQNDNPMYYGTFECIIRHEKVTGQPYAMAMNQELLYRIAAANDGDDPNEISATENTALYEMLKFFEMWQPDGPVVLVGFNVGSFDLAFLKKRLREQGYGTEYVCRRTIELGTYLMPVLGTNIPVKSSKAHEFYDLGEVKHDALGDAKNAAIIFNRAWNALNER